MDYNDLIYRTNREKYNAVIDEIESMYKMEVVRYLLVQFQLKFLKH